MADRARSGQGLRRPHKGKVVRINGIEAGGYSRKDVEALIDKVHEKSLEQEKLAKELRAARQEQDERGAR